MTVLRRYTRKAFPARLDLGVGRMYPSSGATKFLARTSREWFPLDLGWLQVHARAILGSRIT